MKRTPTTDELAQLVGYRFPGGTRTVEHWENWLLTDCTAGPQLSDALVHPIALFHVPIQGANTTIGELFALFGSDGAPGEVSLLGYDWEYVQPLRENVDYRVDGWIESVERTERGDEMAFVIELHDANELVARVTNRWRFNRPNTPRQVRRRPVATAQHDPDATIPSLTVGVDGQRMKTMAALLRDPYPIHWDPDAVRTAGLGDQPINQGPLNLGYVANMLMAWAGDDAIRRLTVRFPDRAHAGDILVAHGWVTERLVVDGERRARCAVELTREGDVICVGTAEVACAPDDDRRTT